MKRATVRSETARPEPQTGVANSIGAGSAPSSVAKQAHGDTKAAAESLRHGMLTLGTDEWTAAAAKLVQAMSGESADTDAPARLKVDASREVVRDRRSGPDNETVLKALFRAKNDSKKNRPAKFKALVEFARESTRMPDRLLWNSKSSDPLAASIRHAWEPLGIWDDELLKNAVREAKELFENPTGKLETSRLALNPLIARWLTVMRSKQLAEAKRRDGT